MGRSRIKDELLALTSRYVQETGVDAIDITMLANWAVENGLYSRPPKSVHQQAKGAFAGALRSARHTDPQGRPVRTMHPVPTPVIGEMQPMFSWVDIRSATYGQMRAALSYRRQMIAADVHRHKVDTDSYNDNNGKSAMIPLAFDYDFNKDVQEAAMPSEYVEEELAADLEANLEAV